MKGEFHTPKRKLRVGVLDVTSMVGQHFLTILEQRPWFEIMVLAASPWSAGKTYEEAVDGRWKLSTPMPERHKRTVIHNVNEIEQVAREMNLVFSAVDMTKEEIRAIEDAYAKHETPIVSNNLAHCWTPGVPMVIPEVNPEHSEVITAQRRHLGIERSSVAVKPSCLIQSYVPVFATWKEFEPYEAIVTAYQAISGAGKNFKDWPEMVGNIIPYVGGKEEKNEKEPLYTYGHIEDDHIESATEPRINGQCIRVPVLNSHTAVVFVKLRKKPTKEQLLEKLATFSGLPQGMKSLSAPQRFVRYMEEENRPQVVLDMNYKGGADISVGRLHEGTIYDWKFVDPSHNTPRDAAGSTVEYAEALTVLGYIVTK